MKRLLAFALLAVGCSSGKPPELLLTLPEFSMTAVGEAGVRPFGRKDLLGKVWVVDFIFTRCSGPCPMLTDHMSRLSEKLPAEVGLLSVSVDPDGDTPEKLREYAKAFKADLKRLVFLRGTTTETYRLLYAGFKQPISMDPKAPEGTRVQHSTRFVLVDQDGGIRGFYDGLGDSEDAALARDIKSLLKERT